MSRARAAFTSVGRWRSGRALLLAGTALAAATGGALADDPIVLDGTGSAYSSVVPATLESNTYIMLNGGFLSLRGDYSAGDAVLDVRDGLLSFWDQADAGTASIALGPTSSAEFRDATSGAAAALTMTGAALLDLSRVDGPGFVLGSLAGDGGVVDLRDVTLELGGNNASTAFFGVIGKAGEDVTGGLTKVGTGTLTLGGNNLYTGATTVAGGGLVVNGDNRASDVLVAADGRLGGTGRIGDLDLFGLVAPGPVTAGLAGTLIVTGDATFRSGSTYLADFTPASHDLLAVAGTVTVEGGTIKVAVLDPQLNYSTAQTHQIIAADALTGADRLTLDLGSPLLFGKLIATGDALSVQLMQAKGFDQAATSSKGKEAGKGMNDLPDTGPSRAIKNQLLAMSSAEIDTTFKALVTTPDATQKISEAAGGGAVSAGKTGASGVNLGSGPGKLVASQVQAQKSGTAQKSAYMAVFEQPSPAGVVAIEAAEQEPIPAQLWSVWLAPVGAYGTAAAGAGTVTWVSGGLQGGLETRIGLGEAELTAGLFTGYQRTGIRATAPASAVDQSGGTIGAYGKWEADGTTLSASLAETVQMVASRRFLTIGALDYTAAADYLQSVTALSAGAAHTLELGDGFAVTPLGSLDASFSYHDGYAETGAGPVGLVVDALGEWRLDAGVGIVAAKSFRSETGTLTASASATYQRVLVDGADTQTMRFVGGTATMEVEKPAGDRDRALLGLGLAYQDDGGFNAALSYAGSFSANGQAHGVSASVGSAF